jgi:hypothetical protein
LAFALRHPDISAMLSLPLHATNSTHPPKGYRRCAIQTRMG